MNNILIAPVSGGKLITQLTALELLCSIKYKPKYALGASGGNASIFISLAADWKWSGIRRISQQLDSSMFLSPWSSIAFISYIIGFFKGSVHSYSDKLMKFYKTHFNSESIQDVETWTVCYNNVKKLNQLFCNKGDTELKLMKECELKRCMNPIYANGDVELIAKYCYATASIPSIVPPQIIQNESYSDGALGCASPMTYMADSFVDLDNYRIVYLSALNLSAINSKEPVNIIDTWLHATSSILHTLLSYDRYIAYLLIKSKGEVKYEEFLFNLNKVESIINSDTKYYLLEIYPKEIISLDIVNFTGDDVFRLMNYIRNNEILYCRYWYV